MGDELVKRPSMIAELQLQDRERKKGSLRKKNSIYFKQGFMADLNGPEDIRQTVKKRMESSVQVAPNDRSRRMKSIYSTRSRAMTNRKNSFYQEGTMEQRLTSMIDIAFLEMQNIDLENVDDEEIEKQRHKLEQDREDYEVMGSSPAFEKYHDKCKKKALKEQEKFYEDYENELEDIEKMLGVDPESLKKLEVRIKETIAANNLAEEEAKKDGKEMNGGTTDAPQGGLGQAIPSNPEGMKKEV